jgi:predicted RNase H-like HicB family nuclease
MTSPLYRRQGVAFRAFFNLDTASGLFAVEFPDLPGCVARGDDFVQARDHAKHVLDAWIDASLARGETVPIPDAAREPRRPVAHTVWISTRSGFDQARRRSPGAAKELNHEYR